MALNLLTISCWASEKSPLAPEKISIAMLNVTVYRDPQHDAVAWTAIINKMRAFESGNFSIESLKETVDFIYQASFTSKGIWGGVPLTLVPDAQSFEGPKK